MESSGAGKPWSESVLLGVALLALLIAGATAADFSSDRLWTLVAGLAALYMLSRGLARSRWPAVRAARPAAPTAPAARPAAPTAPAAPAPPRTPAPSPAPAPQPASETAAEVVLSEERLKVTSRPRPRERVQIRKEIVTEEVTITVPIRREELRIERVPIDAPEHPDAAADVTLMTHEPVVAKEVVPVERVRLEKDVVTQRERVSETVRSERVEFDRRPAPDPPEGAR